MSAWLGIIVPLNLEFVGVSGCMRVSKEAFCMLGQGRASGRQESQEEGERMASQLRLWKWNFSPLTCCTQRGL